MDIPLQDLVEPHGVCFGCGAASAKGLRLKSRPDPDGVHVVAHMTPQEHFCGWPGLVYGGYLAMLCDCHSNWTSIYCHYQAEGRAPGTLPRISCVTGRLTMHYKKPTPMGVPLLLKGRADGPVGRKTRIICEVYAEDELTVLAESVFVRVDPAELARKAHRQT